MSDIDVGDVVRLKSGSPPMTVFAVKESPMGPVIDVRWYCLHDHKTKSIEMYSHGFEAVELTVNGDWIRSPKPA